MAKLQIMLKQHTPIIHFQSEQAGATLRATELKPKLDKFLIQNIFEKKFDNYKEYLIGYSKDKTEKDYINKKPLDYKVKIISKSSSEIEIKYSPYFGKNKFLLENEEILLDIFSLHSELINDILKGLPKFFIFNNFGTRQSKGFGSYYINDRYEYKLNGQLSEYDREEIINAFDSLKYRFDVEIKKNNEANKYEELFKCINSYYSSLRQGRTHGKDTFNPIVMKYFEEKGIQWDKDTIKEKLIGKRIKKVRNLDDRYLVKDLFGLSSREFWREDKVKIIKKNREIERYKSPITFKPIYNENTNSFYVFIIVNEINPKFLNKEFKVINANNKKSKKLRTPRQFDMKDLLDYALENYKKFKFPYPIRKIYQSMEQNMRKEEK